MHFHLQTDGKEFDDIENIRFLKKNVLTSEEQKEYKKIKDKYGLESLDDRFKKEVFGIDKNKYSKLKNFKTIYKNLCDLWFEKLNYL